MLSQKIENIIVEIDVQSKRRIQIEKVQKYFINNKEGEFTYDGILLLFLF